MERHPVAYSVQSSRHRRTCDRDPQAITRGTPREIRLDAVHAARQRCGASGIERTEHETVLVRQRDARRHAQLAEVRWLTRVTSGA